MREYSGPRTAAVLFLVAFLAMTVRDFRYFPGISVLQEAFYVFCFFYLVFGFPLQKIQERKGLSGLEWYSIALIVIVPFAQGAAALHEFGQPMLYGALHERGIITLAGVLFCLGGLRNRLFTIGEVERALLILAWGSAILYIIMNAAIDPNRFADMIGFTAAGDNGAIVFTPQIHFVEFGILYYALRGVRTGYSRNYLAALFLFAGAWGKRGGREVTVALLLSVLFFVWRWKGSERFFAQLPKFLLGLAIILGAYYAVAPGQAANRLAGFEDAFTVMFKGESVQDPSANARITESLFALPGILKHPFVGNGSLSVQWGGGPALVQGGYFSPGDVGMIGALWQYGLILLAFLTLQYWFALRIVKKLPPDLNNPFIDAAKGYVLFFALVSITSAQFVFDIQASLLFIALLQSRVPESISSMSRKRNATALPHKQSLRLGTEATGIQGEGGGV